jgi:hypothetical protein
VFLLVISQKERSPLSYSLTNENGALIGSANERNGMRQLAQRSELFVTDPLTKPSAGKYILFSFDKEV